MVQSAPPDNMSKWFVTAVLLMTAGVIASTREDGVLVLSVTDPASRPVSNVTIATRGDGGTGTSDPTGRARLRLAPQTKPNSTVSLLLVPPTKYVMVVPWQSRARVPPFENESDNYVDVVVCAPPCRDLLKTLQLSAAVAGRVNAIGTSDSTKELTAARRKGLERVAMDLSLEPAALAGAIEKLAAADNAYARGQARLFQLRHAEAIGDFRVALKEREAAVAKRPDDFTDTLFFLGQAQSEAGDFSAAVDSLLRANALRANDPAILSALARNYGRAGLKGEAVAMQERAARINDFWRITDKQFKG
jgi:hypothetical protein